MFDIDNDNFKEQVGWVGGNDAFVVNDLNNNGLVDNLSELIGSSEEDAFSVMRELYDSNHDWKFNNLDTAWNTLKIWQDANSNGITDTNELKTFAQAGLKEFNLEDQVKNKNSHGNIIYSESTVEKTNGTMLKTAAVFFGIDQEVTEFIFPENYTPHADTTFLPELTGGGTVTPLSFAMTQDAALRAKVMQFVQDSATMSFADFREKVEEIVKNWAGVTSAVDNSTTIVEGSRGDQISAVTLAVAEAFAGTTFPVQAVNWHQAELIEMQYNNVIDDITARFMTQIAGSHFMHTFDSEHPENYTGHPMMLLSLFNYDVPNNTLQGDFKTIFEVIQQSLLGHAEYEPLGADFVAAFQQYHVRDFMEMVYHNNAAEWWKVLNETIDDMGVEFDFFGYDVGDLLPMPVENIATGRDWMIIENTTSNVLAMGTNGDDIIVGNNNHNPNIIYGGQGNDTLIGADGADTYLFAKGDGQDIIEDSSSAYATNIVRISGYVLGQMHFERVYKNYETTHNDLRVTFDGTDDELIIRATLDTDERNGIQKFYFPESDTYVEMSAIRSLIATQEANGRAVTDGFIAQNQVIGSNSLSDTLTGTSAGSDYISGKDKGDTYVYNIGGGYDCIDDNGATGTDRLMIQNTYTNTFFARSPANYDDLIITFANAPTDKILVKSAIGEDSLHKIEQFVFGGVITITTQQIRESLLAAATTSGNDDVVGYATDDHISGGSGNDYLEGREGDDTYSYYGGWGKDVIADGGLGDTDILLMETISFNDIIFRQGAIDHADLIMTFKNNPNDRVIIHNTIDENDFYRIEEIRLANNVTVTMEQVRDLVLYNAATDHDDLIKGYNASDDTIYGRDGHDKLYGYQKDDSLYGENGHDMLIGGYGDDRLEGGAGNDMLVGEQDNDTLIGGAGSDNLNGSTGTDTADYSASSAGIIVNLTTGIGSGGDAMGDILSNIERLTGSAFNDSLYGDSGINLLTGKDGLDILYGYDGNDTLNADAGNDRLYGGNGNDTLNGSDGIDTFYGDAGNDIMNGGNDVDLVSFLSSTSAIVARLSTGLGSLGDANGDTYTGIENLYGSNYNDLIKGNGLSNKLYGWDGADNINGAGGSDQLYGGTGAESFVYQAITDSNTTAFDTICDFETGTDKITLFGITTIDDFSDLTLSYNPTTDQTTVTSVDGFKLLVNDTLTQGDFVFM